MESSIKNSQVAEGYVLLIDLTRLFHQYFIKMKVVLISSFIKYTICFTFRSSIFRCDNHFCLKNTTTTKGRVDHQNTCFVKRGCWLQWGRRTYFRKSLVSWSIITNRNVTIQYSVWTRLERGVFSANSVIWLLGTAYYFVRTTRYLYLIWSLQ